MSKVGVFHLPPGLMRGWQWSAPNLRWRKSRTDLYSALFAGGGQSWGPLVLEISILLWVPNGNLTQNKRRVFYLNLRPLNNSMETYLTEVSSIIFCSLGFRFLIWMILVLIWWTSEVFYLLCTLSKSWPLAVLIKQTFNDFFVLDLLFLRDTFF